MIYQVVEILIWYCTRSTSFQTWFV